MLRAPRLSQDSHVRGVFLRNMKPRSKGEPRPGPGLLFFRRGSPPDCGWDYASQSYSINEHSASPPRGRPSAFQVRHPDRRGARAFQGLAEWCAASPV